MDKIANSLEALSEAGVPVHILMGRRKESGSSLYWAWPYRPEYWQKLQDKDFDFDVNFKEIVRLVDTLSIYYDLRNPLSEERLEEIEVVQPAELPSAKCPMIPCPWAVLSAANHSYNNGKCTFAVHRTPIKDVFPRPNSIIDKSSTRICPTRPSIHVSTTAMHMPSP